MITYDEFVDRLRAENDSDDTELALMLFCIEDEYGTNDLGQPDFEAALEAEGYDEDDYFNGTGAYVVTTRFLSVGAVDCFNDDGEAARADFCESQLHTMVA